MTVGIREGAVEQAGPAVGLVEPVVVVEVVRVAGRAPMASVPNWVTFTPDSKQMYVSNAALNAVTAIDTQAMKEMAVIPVGQAPKRIGTLVAN